MDQVFKTSLTIKQSTPRTTIPLRQRLKIQYIPPADHGTYALGYQPDQIKRTLRML